RATGSPARTALHRRHHLAKLILLLVGELKLPLHVRSHENADRAHHHAGTHHAGAAALHAGAVRPGGRGDALEAAWGRATLGGAALRGALKILAVNQSRAAHR